MDTITLINKLLGEENQLVEEAQEKIKTAIDSKVNELVEERSQLIREELDTEHAKALKTLMEKQDSDAAAKIELLKEELDRTHYQKAKEMFQKLDNAYAKKLASVKEHYEDGLLKEQKTFSDELVKNIDSFLVEEVLKELVPTEKLEEVAKIRHSQKLMEEMRDLMGVNEALKDKSIRTAVADGGETINKQKERIAVLEEKTRKYEVEAFLNESVKDLPAAKANYIVEQLKDKTLDFAERNLNFVVKEFDKKSDDERKAALLNEQTTPNNDQLVTESVEEPNKQESSWISGWATQLTSPKLF
jgi:hypothetical protein